MWKQYCVRVAECEVLPKAQIFRTLDGNAEVWRELIDSSNELGSYYLLQIDGSDPDRELEAQLSDGLFENNCVISIKENVNYDTIQDLISQDWSKFCMKNRLSSVYGEEVHHG